MKKIYITRFMASALMVILLFAIVTISNSINADALIDVTVKTNVSAYGTVDSNDSNAVMAVSISWDNFNFEYDSSTEWNSDKLDYIETNGGWIKDTGTIIVTNSSNIIIDVETSFKRNQDNDMFENVTASFDKTTARINSAVDHDTAPSETFSMKLRGTLPILMNQHKIGTLVLLQ